MRDPLDRAVASSAAAARPARGGRIPRARGSAASGVSPLVVFPYAVSDGAANMAMDEAMMDLARGGATVLRLYGWEPWCLSLGRNQPAPARILGGPRERLRLGVDVVRRPTGGRSVLHGPEVTYAFACPDRSWGGPRAVYGRVHRALATALSALGVPLDADDAEDQARRAGESRAPGAAARLAPGPAACFRDPAPGELTVRGRKLVGSAQWRHRRALLQHGSILLSNRQAPARLDDEDPASACEDPAATALDEILPRVPSRRDLAASLEAEITRAFCGARDEAGEPARASALRARGWPPGPTRRLDGPLPVHTEGPERRPLEALDRGAREARYRSASWQWRR